MRRLAIVSAAIASLTGCGSVALDEARHILGVVTSSTTASTPADRPGLRPFMIVGATGGLVAAQTGTSPDGTIYIHNRLYVKTDSGEVVVDTDDYFPPGSCVEITPAIGEQSSTFFSYRSARIVASDKCGAGKAASG